jgi:hypothetical protein
VTRACTMDALVALSFLPKSVVGFTKLLGVTGRAIFFLVALNTVGFVFALDNIENTRTYSPTKQDQEHERRKGGRLVTDYRGRIYDAKTLGLLERTRVRRCMMGDFAFYLLTRSERQSLHRPILVVAYFGKQKCMRWVDSLPQPPWPSTRVS